MTGRRYFLKTVAAGAAAARYAWPANDTINIGCIGTGGRAQVLMRSLEQVKGARITAVCDIWDDNLAKARQLAGSGAFAAKDYRAILDRKDIDAVLIGAPDHQHVPLTVAACAAGKDVYVEKPLTHDLSEGQKVIDAQNQHKRIVQVGMQQRSMPQFQKGYEIVRSGKIGKIHKVHLTWNRNSPRGQTQYSIDPKTVDWKGFLGSAPEQPFDAYRFRQWRWFWDFGGGVFTDLMVHFIDVAHWYLDVDHPEEAVSIGDQFQMKGVWETPDTAQTLLRYPDRQAQAYYEGTFVNARNAAMIEFMGTEGTLYLDRGRYELYPERDKFAYSEWTPGEGKRGADFYKNPDGELLHLTNWIQCVRSRNKPNAPAEAGVSAASAAHMANIAYRSGETARWTGRQPLFNGKDLDGWQVDTPGIWSVRDGIIVGRHEGIKYNDFLRTKRDFGDFTLRAWFRLVGGQGNSGVQFRSKPVPDSHEVSGYQADVGQQYWGCLYDESRRRKVLAQASAESLAKLKKDGWNEYTITARGRRITLTLNGVTTVDYEETEPGIEESGFIALQVHGGPPMEVHFKNIELIIH